MGAPPDLGQGRPEPKSAPNRSFRTPIKIHFRPGWRPTDPGHGRPEPNPDPALGNTRTLRGNPDPALGFTRNLRRNPDPEFGPIRDLQGNMHQEEEKVSQYFACLGSI